MNRKEAILMGGVLLTTFIGGVFAAPVAPGILNVLVTNFPSNQQVNVSNFPKTQNVSVTNPTATSLTVRNLASQKTLTIMAKQNVSLACFLECFILASSPVNSSLGYRNAFVYIHWDKTETDSIEGASVTLLADQTPSQDFPSSCIGNCSITISAPSGVGGPVDASIVHGVQGEQFVFQIKVVNAIAENSNLLFTNLSLSVFLEN